jgi:hypothetical protein
MIAAGKAYTLSIRQGPKFAPQRHIFNGRRKIATVTECQYQHKGEWEVTLLPAGLGSWHATESAALEFIRSNEENYLSCMGGSVVVEYAK